MATWSSQSSRTLVFKTHKVLGFQILRQPQIKISWLFVVRPWSISMRSQTQAEWCYAVGCCTCGFSSMVCACSGWGLRRSVAPEVSGIKLRSPWNYLLVVFDDHDKCGVHLAGVGGKATFHPWTGYCSMVFSGVAYYRLMVLHQELRACGWRRQGKQAPDLEGVWLSALRMMTIWIHTVWLWAVKVNF